MTEDCLANETIFYDLRDGFVVLRRACRGTPPSVAALERAREQLPSILRDARIDRGSNHFNATVSDGNGDPLALLQITIFVEDPPIGAPDPGAYG